MQRQKVNWSQFLVGLAWLALGVLVGIILCNYKALTLKPELSMDGISTIVAGLVLVIILNIAAANHLERRHSSVELLTSDVREVATAVREVHEYVAQHFPPSNNALNVNIEQQGKLQLLLQEYSNSLSIIDHTLVLCGLNAKAELDVCKQDRARYIELLTGGQYPELEGSISRKETGAHMTIQQNLRALLVKIGLW